MVTVERVAIRLQRLDAGRASATIDSTRYASARAGYAPQAKPQDAGNHLSALPLRRIVRDIARRVPADISGDAGSLIGVLMGVDR